MTGEAATVTSTIHSLQAALYVLATAELTAYLYPPSTNVTNGTYFDYVVIGAGSGGSVAAGRLSEKTNKSVLVIEAGGYAPLESGYAGLFTMLPNSSYDWNMTSVNDNYTAQYANGGVVPLTAGKMLGGSSSLHHMIYTQGAPSDFAAWETATNDSSWNYDGLLEYFKLLERVEDDTLLSSSSIQYHGTDGALGLTRETSSLNAPLLAAYKEAGCPVEDDMTGLTNGVCEPLFMIADNTRQSNSLGYISPGYNRSNLVLTLNSFATKLIIEDTVAKGVEYIDSDGQTKVVYANNEVIVSAGAINSPKILMLSGIGPKATLEDLGISVVVDQEQVGKNLMDHPSVPVVFALETTSEATRPTNPYLFPVPTTTQYADYDSDGSPDYQSINLLFQHDSTALQQLCLNVFQFQEDVCQEIYDEGSGRNLLNGVFNMLHPASRGETFIQSSDPNDDALIYLHQYSNNTDVVNMGLYLADFYNKLMNTTYFQSVNASMLTLGVCTDYTFGSTDYWQCYAVTTSNTMWHYCGTCAMGTVLNTDCQVEGVSNLRVIDASAMPSITSGNINAAVTVLAEKCTAMVIADASS